MKCPVCKDIDLIMSERQGVEIDYCPSCRGVWLDRGELDKIIDKSASFSNENSYKQNKENSFQNHSKQNYHNESHHNSHHNTYPKKKKEGFLSEIFDFDF